MNNGWRGDNAVYPSRNCAAGLRYVPGRFNATVPDSSPSGDGAGIPPMTRCAARPSTPAPGLSLNACRKDRIVESGSQPELIARGGRDAEWWAMQNFQ